MDKNNIAIPFSIIIAGLLIAGAVYFGGNKSPSTNPTPAPVKTADIKAVGKDEHFLGSPSAKVTIVEYSDLQCPFCQKFHESMKEIMDTYGKDGKVKLVYRHFPLVSIHANAQKAAEGSECAAELGGETKFWEFVENIFADGTTQADKVKNLAAVASSIGLDQQKFTECLNSGKYAKKVTDSTNEGVGAGITGTPASFVVVNGKVVDTIKGFAPASNVKAIIDKSL